MTMSDFFISYADEAKCKQFFKERREQSGLVCSCCGSLCFYWIEKESRWRCKGCGTAISLKKGTVMEDSNLGYKVWLWGLYLMSLTKKGFSALEIQRLIGHKRYEPIWLMLHKIRICMGQRDDQYQLDGYIEMDEGFFAGHRKKDLNGLAAKELDRQVKAIVAVNVTPVVSHQQKPYRPTTQAGYIKIMVVNSLCKKEVNYEAEKKINPSATILTDGRSCYNDLKDACSLHEKKIIKNKKQVSSIFPWVHTAISNVKKKLLGLHHHVKDAYMQNYFNEFCYKFNRRHFGQSLFNRLLIATLHNSWYRPFPNSG